tara:strand:- start:1781 stop:1999 length:219 start_codon:yes stop_codon:yes gene_type:complete
MTGFNKRYLKEETLIKRFNENGIKGIEKYIGKSDALFTSSEKVSDILDVLYCEDCETKKELEIKKIIDNELS